MHWTQIIYKLKQNVPLSEGLAKGKFKAGVFELSVRFNFHLLRILVRIVFT